MSSLPPPTVVLAENAAAVTTVRSDEPFQKKRLLYRNRYARPDQTPFTYGNYTTLDALQTSSSYSYSSSTHYRESPATGNDAGSTTFKDLVPLPEAFTQSHAYNLVEPFLLPLLFPLGCFTAMVHSISIMLPILPVALFVGLAGSILIPLVCLGGMSLAGLVMLKGILKAAEKQTRAMARLGVMALEAMDRVMDMRVLKNGMVALGYLAHSGMGSDDGRVASSSSSKRAALKPGPSILKPARPLQFYDDLPPSPLSTNSIRPRSSSISAMSPGTKAKDVFKSCLLAEKEEKAKHSTIQPGQTEMHEVQVEAQNSLPTPPDSDVSPSLPLGALDIPPYNPVPSSLEEEGGADAEASPTSPHYFTSRHHSASTASNSSTASSSSYAPTPRTPGSPLVSAMYTPGSSHPRRVKHVRIVDPADEALRYYNAEVEDDDVDDLDDYAKPLREFAAAKLQDALGLLQTSAGQVWGSS